MGPNEDRGSKVVCSQKSPRPAPERCGRRRSLWVPEGRPSPAVNRVLRLLADHQHRIFTEFSSVSLSNLTLRTWSVWGNTRDNIGVKKTTAAAHSQTQTQAARQSQPRPYRCMLTVAMGNIPSSWLSRRVAGPQVRNEKLSYKHRTPSAVAGLQAPANESEGLLFHWKAHQYLSFVSCRKPQIRAL